jgi:hypothetical protein
VSSAQYDVIQSALADPATVAALYSDVTVPAEITSWLGLLACLKSVPLAYLVPDPAMLPPESIRFFRVDPNWITALLEGACSVGRATAAEQTHDEALAVAVHAALAVDPVMTGFLLRSAVVVGWPGLEVVSYDADWNQFPATSVLRMERLAPGLLLYLVAGAIETVDIREPAEGLHFGLDVVVGGGPGALAPTKGLRDVTTGAQTNTTAAVTFRPDSDALRSGSRVVDISTTATAIQTALGGSPITSAELALELVEGVQEVSFSTIVVPHFRNVTTVIDPTTGLPE